MRFDRLDLNLLVALDILIEERSVSAAARRLHLSQPAVTGALNRLREFFGDDLLVLSGRRMLLTPKAEELADPVRRALMQIRAEITRPREFDPATVQRHFTLALSDYAFTVLFADVIAAAAREAPGLSFELMPPSPASAQRLERAEVDLFVTVSQFEIGTHPRLPLFQDKDVLISWRDAGIERIDVDEFFAAGHAVATFGLDLQPAISDAAIEEIGRERRIEVIVPNFSLLPQAIVGTRRLAIMHSLYARHFMKFYPIAVHPVPVPLPEIVEIAQWNSVREDDAGLKWLIGIVRSRCAALLGDACLTEG